jgi:hypothetical protein
VLLLCSVHLGGRLRQRLLLGWLLWSVLQSLITYAILLLLQVLPFCRLVLRVALCMLLYFLLRLLTKLLLLLLLGICAVEGIWRARRAAALFQQPCNTRCCLRDGVNLYMQAAKNNHSGKLGFHLQGIDSSISVVVC